MKLNNMKKIIFCLIFFLIVLNSNAQTLNFDGAEMGKPLNEFVEVLKNKGYIATDIWWLNQGNDQGFIGKYKNVRAYVSVFENPIFKVVTNVNVTFQFKDKKSGVSFKKKIIDYYKKELSEYTFSSDNSECFTSKDENMSLSLFLNNKNEVASGNEIYDKATQYVVQLMFIVRKEL